MFDLINLHTLGLYCLLFVMVFVILILLDGRNSKKQKAVALITFAPLLMFLFQSV